jgi:predicted Zn-dependent peptidase
MFFDRTVLANGLTVITEPMEGIRSLAVGVWLNTGSRDELENERGASHFLEHLLFKGTESMSALEIAQRFDAIGAEANAFTTKDATCFWVRLLDENLAEGLDLLAAMVQRPAFRRPDVESERDVVLEELNMSEDDPEDVVHERFLTEVFHGHPLAYPVLGSRASVESLTGDVLGRYWQRRYRAASSVIAASGHVDHAQLVDLAGDAFAGWNGRIDHRKLTPTGPAGGVDTMWREGEQVHLVLGGRGPSRKDTHRYAFGVLDSVLGGTTSSRLFHAVRENRGLAYSVYSFRSAFEDAGAYGVYVATTPRNVPVVLEVLAEELDGLIRDGVTEAELARVKGGVRGSMALALEDPNSRMMRLGGDELSGEEHLTVDELIAKVDAVTVDDVRDAAEAVLTGPRLLTTVGPIGERDLEGYA